MSVAARPGGGSRTAPFGLLGDERLARLAAAGHDRAFAVVYERHHQALYRYCRSILRNDADAQDALQSTFAAAFAALGRGGPDAPIRPWLFRIAHNEAVSALRRRRPTADLSEAQDWCTISVEDQVTERAEIATLLGDLRELNERQRSALVMRELSGLSHEEIAIALATSVGAAKQTIYEARQSLFEFAEGRAMPCDDIRRTISDADGRLLRSRRVRAHLRECAACAAFTAAIPARTQELGALAPPISAVMAAGLLGRIAAAGSSSHAAGGGVAGLAGGAAGKTAGAAFAANALAGVAVVATATVGVTVGVDKLVHPGARSHPGAVVAPSAGSVAGGVRTSSADLVVPRQGMPSWGARGAGPGEAPGGRLRSLAPAASRAGAYGPVLSTSGKSTSVTWPWPGGPAGTGSAIPGGSAPGGRGKESAGNRASPPGGAGHPAQPGGSKPDSTGPQNPASTGSGKPGQTGAATHGQAGAATHGQAGAATHGQSGAANPGNAGAGNPGGTGSGQPAWAGSGKPAWAGSNQPASTGSGQSDSVGSGKPQFGGSGGGGSSSAGGSPAAGAGQSAGAPATGQPAAPPATPPQAAPGGPPADTPGATNSAGHGH